MIDISSLDRPNVLRALYDAARPLGMGMLQSTPEPMGRDEAVSLLAHQTYFDYLKGRVMKVELGREQFDGRLYDRDNGPGAAAAAVEGVRPAGSNSTPMPEEPE